MNNIYPLSAVTAWQTPGTVQAHLNLVLHHTFEMHLRVPCYGVAYIPLALSFMVWTVALPAITNYCLELEMVALTPSMVSCQNNATFPKQAVQSRLREQPQILLQLSLPPDQANDLIIWVMRKDTTKALSLQFRLTGTFVLLRCSCLQLWDFPWRPFYIIYKLYSAWWLLLCFKVLRRRHFMDRITRLRIISTSRLQL